MHIGKTALAWRQGYKRPCIVLPCGGGKSVITAEMGAASRCPKLIIQNQIRVALSPEDALRLLGVGA